MRYGEAMSERFAEMLKTGGHANSLGRVDEVIATVLGDQSRLEELYMCLFEDDAWVRMRAADALEKICRSHPDWLLPYIDRWARELAASDQASIQWHLAQIYREVPLNDAQKNQAVHWLAALLSQKDVDWIVAANAMVTLVQFTKDGSFPKANMLSLLGKQQHHHSKSVVRRATKLLSELHASTE